MSPTYPEIVRARLGQQQLSGSPFGGPAALLHWFGAMQAQEYALTKWAIGLRLPQLVDTQVEAAFTSGEILRTHLLRPTWHFVSPADIRWMLKLTAPRVQAGNAYMYRKMELDAGLFPKCNKVIQNLLEGGDQLTRPQIATVLEERGISADGLRLSLIMMQAELEGLICSGARKGNQFTYAWLEDRVPIAPDLLGDEALATLALRYFTSRGPATILDFSTWSGLSVTDARSAVSMIGSQLTRLQIEGQDYFCVPSAIIRTQQAAVAQLLPPYDEYIMGYKNRDAILPRGDARLKLRFYNMIIFEGSIVGSWRRTIGNQSVAIDYHFVQSRGKVVRPFRKAAQLFGAFLGLAVHLNEK